MTAERERQIREIWDIGTSGELLLRELDAERQVNAELLAALKEIDAWFERMHADHSAKLGHGLQDASENWPDILQEPLDLTKAKAAIARAELALGNKS